MSQFHTQRHTVTAPARAEGDRVQAKAVHYLLGEVTRVGV